MQRIQLNIFQVLLVLHKALIKQQRNLLGIKNTWVWTWILPFPTGSTGNKSVSFLKNWKIIPTAYGPCRLKYGEGNGNPFQSSCLENPMDSRAWRATVHGVAKSQTWLNDWAHTHSRGLLPYDLITSQRPTSKCHPNRN